MASSLAPERVRHVRVAIVGDTGCGKSTLTRVLAGDPDARVERTSGVNPRVRLIDVFEPHANALRPCFVELWDLGGREDHKPERGVLYHDLDGVVLVHDLSLSRRVPEMRENLTRWAREVAASATFAAPSPDACPWRVSHTEDARGDASPHILRGGFGGVPVPVLVVGAKAELRRADGAREAFASTFADDDFFGGARAGGFDPSERAAAFVRRLCARVARTLRLRGHLFRWRDIIGAGAKHKQKHKQKGVLPTTTRDAFLRRAFSGDALANLARGVSGAADGNADSTSDPVPINGGLLCRNLERFFLSHESDGDKNENVPLEQFDAYFAELLARRLFSPARSFDEQNGRGASFSTFPPTFSLDAETSGNTKTFSFPGKIESAPSATLRGGGATTAMWMGGDRLDAGDG